MKNERYYFSKNKSIKNEIKTFDEIEMAKSEIISIVYFENEEIIKFWSDRETEFNTSQILEKARKLNSSYLQFQNLSNDIDTSRKT